MREGQVSTTRLHVARLPFPPTLYPGRGISSPYLTLFLSLVLPLSLSLSVCLSLAWWVCTHSSALISQGLAPCSYALSFSSTCACVCLCMFAHVRELEGPRRVCMGVGVGVCVYRVGLVLDSVSRTRQAFGPLAQLANMLAVSCVCELACVKLFTYSN